MNKRNKKTQVANKLRAKFSVLMVEYIMTWYSVVRKSSIGDKFLKNRVRIYYERLRLAKWIRDMDINRQNKSITVYVYPDTVGLLIGIRGETVNKLSESMGWTINIRGR